MGIKAEDSTRLVPITPNAPAFDQPNWDTDLKAALSQRPEIILARENLRLAKLNLLEQKNSLKPDLRFIGQYSPVCPRRSLAGTGQMVNGGPFPVVTSNAFTSLASGLFSDWTAGLASTFRPVSVWNNAAP